ncbi:MAG: DoxX family protein [Actinobacteria bacterium]|nr:DoxX family protein [Actinomycetota bacterium]
MGMNFVSTVLAILLIVVCVASAIMDFRKPEQLVEQMKKLKVPADRLPLLGAIKIAGAIGLAIGFQKVRLGELAGICLALYFAIAVVTHTRVKDSVKDTLPAFMLCVMSLLYVLTTVAK